MSRENYYVTREQMGIPERGEERKGTSQRHFYDNMTREQTISPQRKRVIEVNKSALSAVSIQYHSYVLACLCARAKKNALGGYLNERHAMLHKISKKRHHVILSFPCPVKNQQNSSLDAIEKQQKILQGCEGDGPFRDSRGE